LRRCILRSRRRTARCELSARLFSRKSSRPVARSASQRLERGTVGRQSIGHEPIRYIALAFEQLPKQSLGRALVAALLNENVQDLPLVINGPPHKLAAAVDTNDHLIEVPDGARARLGSPDIGCNGPAELLGPAADRLIRSFDAPLGQELLDIPQAEGEPARPPAGSPRPETGAVYRKLLASCLSSRDKLPFSGQHRPGRLIAATVIFWL